MPDLPSGTVTFLISDVVGSTQRWATGNMAEALAIHDELTREAIEFHRGAWVKHTGDGVLAAFDQPRDAIRAAIRLQRALRDADWGGEPIRVRVGIHTGEASPRDGDYFGMPVSATARIADAAHGEQTLVSTATHALVRDHLADEVEFVDLGKHSLRGLDADIGLYQLDAEGLVAEFPPLRSMSRSPHNLPDYLTSFVGRQQELDHVVRLVRDHRLTTITGVGGAGKTRVSIEGARRLVDDYADGVWLVELAPLNDPAGVVSELAAALDLRFEEGDAVDTTQRVTEYLKDRQLLVVFDNCEHVLSAVAGLTAELLASCSRVAVLASSREGLGLTGERIWQLPSLDVEGPDADATALFVARAQDAGATIPMEDATVDHIVRICALLDGVPLAIELAAARARMLSPQQIEERLADRFRLLTGGSRLALPRQQTLEATVDWSYDLLSDEERVLFERLSVFQGGFDLDDAEGTCADELLDEYAIFDLLTNLIDKSIVTAEPSTTRYALLETLRQYGARKLQDRGQTAVWKARHAGWFAGRADVHNPQRTGDLDDLGWLQREAPNLTAALEWSRFETTQHRAQLAEVLGLHHWFNLGDPIESLVLLEEALAHTGADDHERRADIHARLVQPLTAVGRIEEAVTAGERCREIVGQGVSPESAARALRRVGMTFAFEPDIDTAVGLAMSREAVAAARLAGGRTLKLALDALAWALMWAEGSYEELQSVSEEAVVLAADDRAGAAQALVPLLHATMAEDHSTGSTKTAAIEDRILEGGTGGVMEAWIGIRRADWDLADVGISQVYADARGRHRIDALVTEGCMLWMRGRLHEADRAFSEAADLGRVGRWHHDVYPMWAEVNCQLRRLDRTSAVVQEHMGLAVRSIEEPLKLGSLRALTQAHVDDGDAASAEDTVARMRRILRDHPHRLTGSPQVASPEGYLAMAEAELTRLSTPSAEAWRRAADLNIWEYWVVYCRARAAEATIAPGDRAGAIQAATRRAAAADAGWVLDWLTRLEP